MSELVYKELKRRKGKGSTFPAYLGKMLNVQRRKKKGMSKFFGILGKEEGQERRDLSSGYRLVIEGRSG